MFLDNHDIGNRKAFSVDILDQGMLHKQPLSSLKKKIERLEVSFFPEVILNIKLPSGFDLTESEMPLQRLDFFSQCVFKEEKNEINSC